jgi:hypothetical protein
MLYVVCSIFGAVQTTSGPTLYTRVNMTQKEINEIKLALTGKQRQVFERFVKDYEELKESVEAMQYPAEVGDAFLTLETAKALARNEIYEDE